VAPSAPARKAGRGAGGGGGAYTIQVAAYGARAPAEQLRRKLAARGYDARVTQVGAVYRVRVGRFRTRSEAAAAAQAMAAKQLTAIVVEAEPR
jgi:cell division protein FtsN